MLWNVVENLWNKVKGKKSNMNFICLTYLCWDWKESIEHNLKFALHLRQPLYASLCKIPTITSKNWNWNLQATKWIKVPQTSMSHFGDKYFLGGGESKYNKVIFWNLFNFSTTCVFEELYNYLHSWSKWHNRNDS